MKNIGYLLVAFSLLGCRHFLPEASTTPPLFLDHPPERTGIHFANTLYETSDLNILTFEYLYNGAGVAVGDINQDGLQDVYFSGNMTNGKLYLNKGNFHFEDITQDAGIHTDQKWGTGVSMVDINADGRLDLYLCFAGPYGPERRRNMLYINNGPSSDGSSDITFTENAHSYGLDDDAHTTHAAFLDYDKDGDLDVYLLNNITEELGPNVIRPKKLKGEMPNTDRLYRNDGTTFTNVSKEAGILQEGYGLGVSVGDINQDNWPDIYVSNDYLSNDLLFINNQDGTFSDRAAQYLRHSSYSSMGCDLADFNNDGLLDIVAVDMLPPDHQRRKLMTGSINYNRFRSEILSGYFPQYMRNTLQLNQGKAPNGDLVFSEIGQLAGIQSTDWSWSPLLQDLDNDGFKDLIITNGYPRDITNMDFASYKANLMMNQQYNQAVLQQLIMAVNEVDGAYLPNYVFQNQGNLTFRDRSEAWGFDQPSFSHGAVVADLDNDGDLDFIANNSFDKVFIYENQVQQHNDHHFLRLELSGPAPNVGALGAKVWLFQDSSMQFYEHYPYRGFQSTVEPIIHFGLGQQEWVDSVLIQWPDDSRQVIRNPQTDQLLQVPYNAQQTETRQKTAAKTPLFSSLPTAYNLDFLHQDPYYSDFKVAPLLPQKHSQDGPSISVGDVNGDELDDVFIGGAFRQTGSLFTQQTNGTFLPTAIGKNEAMREDLGSLFFDADQDGDLDLYVTSGSNEFPLGSPHYQDRLYYNDGQGNFTLAPDALPVMHSSTGCVAQADFDQDGDLDLFVGGRGRAGRYPEPARSYLLENQEGKFIDVTDELGPKLMNYGIITDAQWADMDQDGWPDLLLCGEWLPVSYFKNEQGILKNQTAEQNLGKTVGWWNRLKLHDLDLDGDLDLIVGNLGWNTPFRTSPSEPVSLFVDDFDQNGLPDPIMTYYLQGRQAPVRFRDDLLNWVFPLKKKYRDYQSFAAAEWKDIFPDHQPTRMDADLFASCWLENTGHAQFKVHPLPIEAQTAPVYGILVDDLNQDGLPDILLSGNTSAPDPYVGRYDAFNGLLLLGSADGNFLPQSIQTSGIFIPGEGRDLVKLKTATGEKMILATQNSGPLLIFTSNASTTDF